MDYIREALDKAHASLDKSQATIARSEPGGLATAPRPAAPVAEKPAAPKWTARQVELKPALLERNRIVAYSMSDPGYVPFNLLRTRIRKAMGDNSWATFGITSPTPDCGKTTVAVNLALSLARSEGVRTVLIDLDLKKPGVAKMLGIKPTQTLSSFLRRQGRVEDCFVQVLPELTIGLNSGHASESAELIHSGRLDELMAFVRDTIAPTAILVDLPPMGTGDDVLAILPRLDAALLVAASGKTTVAEVDDCERQLSDEGKLLGIVLNKDRSAGKEYYYY